MKNYVFKRFIAATFLLMLTACTSVPKSPPEGKKETEADNSVPAWSYHEEGGPDHWGKIDSAFSDCANGTEQSPIDIELANVQLDKGVADINLSYQPTAFTIMNNGHTIQANDASGSNTITVDDEDYSLVQMHFHKPSEHQLNGQPFEMEGHLVHQNKEGKLAVLGFLIQEGEKNQVLAEMWSKLPQEKTEEDVPLDKTVDLENLLPEEKTFLRYSGSLTTPPCSEGVKWLLLDQPIEMSKAQIDAFGAIYPNNSRPTQPLDGRNISEIE